MRILHVLPLITARAGGPVAFATEAAGCRCGGGTERELGLYSAEADDRACAAELPPAWAVIEARVERPNLRRGGCGCGEYAYEQSGDHRDSEYKLSLAVHALLLVRIWA